VRTLAPAEFFLFYVLSARCGGEDTTYYSALAKHASASGRFCCKTLKFADTLYRALGLRITFCSYKKLAIFTTNVHAKNECLCHHKTVIRSTEPPISCRCCYRLAFLSVVGYNHFYVVRFCHLSSAFLSGLCVGCFIFF